ncbi:MAG: hypothetical protein HC884_05955 [Chloroflexaceae bacterium]|nr:hypothetical protein [Chloroflexaceae bacterium]
MTPPYHYRNPYDFVPLEDHPVVLDDEQQRCISQAHVRGYSGQMQFDLQLLTPLCILQESGTGQKLYRFAHRSETPIIPATALKGMLRSVHEVVTNSSMGMLAPKLLEKFADTIPKAYRPGCPGPDLTPSEALFGMVRGQDNNIVGGSAIPDSDEKLPAKASDHDGTLPLQDHPVGYAGRLLLSDMVVSPSILVQQPVARPRGGQPKPDHRSFYFFRPSGSKKLRILGRKFYYHQDHQYVMDFYRNERAGATEIRRTELASADSRITGGTLRFFNLSHDELCSLVYTIVLEDDLAHKLGYGKPLGLGSVRLHITKMEIERSEGAVPARFLSYGEPDREDWTDRVAALRDAAKDVWLKRARGAESYAAFAAIARWPQTENFIYPDYGFFQNERERKKPQKTTLWEYQGRRTPHPGRSAPPSPLPYRRSLHPLGAGTETDIPPDPPPRRRGMLGKGSRGGYAVFDGGEELMVKTTGASKKLIQKHMNRLQNGEHIPVSYLREEDDGRAMATNLREEQP